MFIAVELQPNNHEQLPSDHVAQSVEQRLSTPEVVCSLPTQGRVFLCPWTITRANGQIGWITWD